MQVPGKNILILGAICLSVIGGVGAYKVAQAARSNLKANNPPGGIEVSADETNATKPDNKLLSALQEIDATAETNTEANPFDPSPDDTMTTRLSKNFFSSYAQTQGTEGDSLSDEDLVNNALSTVDVSKLPKEKYSMTDMHIIAGTDTELRTYGNDLVTIQNSELMKIKENPSSYEKNLNAIGGIYSAVAAKLIAMPVPVSVSAEHLSIVNAYQLSADDFVLIEDQAKDPMKSLLGLRQYKDAVDRQRQMYTDIAAYLRSSGILFGETEPGYFWENFDISVQNDTSLSQ